jgi:hypothetical protein
LYQKWIYPVDKKRTNEFGTTGDGTAPEDENLATPIAPSAVTQTTHPKSE